jgi:hypothetical protein
MEVKGHLLAPALLIMGTESPDIFCIEEWVGRSGPGGEKKNLCLAGNRAPNFRSSNQYLVTTLAEARRLIYFVCLLNYRGEGMSPFGIPRVRPLAL